MVGALSPVNHEGLHQKESVVVVVVVVVEWWWWSGGGVELYTHIRLVSFDQQIVFFMTRTAIVRLK